MIRILDWIDNTPPYEQFFIVGGVFITLVVIILGIEYIKQKYFKDE